MIPPTQSNRSVVAVVDDDSTVMASNTAKRSRNGQTPLNIPESIFTLDSRKIERNEIDVLDLEPLPLTSKRRRCSLDDFVPLPVYMDITRQLETLCKQPRSRQVDCQVSHLRNTQKEIASAVFSALGSPATV